MALAAYKMIFNTNNRMNIIFVYLNNCFSLIVQFIVTQMFITSRQVQYRYIVYSSGSQPFWIRVTLIHDNPTLRLPNIKILVI